MENNLDQPVNQQSAIPQQPAFSNKNNSKKIFWIIFVVFILIAFLAGGYFLGAKQNKLIVGNQQITPTIVQSIPTTTSDPTTNWKTYTNTKYGIEFKYPLNLSQVNTVDDGSVVAFTDQSNTKPRLSTSPDISLKIIPIAVGVDYKNLLIKDAVFAGSGLHPKSFVEFSSKTIGANTVYYIKTDLSEGVLSLNYYLIGKDQVAVFTLVSSPVDWTNPSFNFENDYLNKSLQQMLSTFKFTDQNQTTINAIAEKVFRDWLESSKMPSVEASNRLDDYVINSIVINIKEENCFQFNVDFSVKTAMGQSYWIAGNGITGENNWVNHKNLDVNVSRINNAYAITEKGTALGPNCQD